jgi:DhnA family fructose-bisphosphate aldolase class Ia
MEDLPATAAKINPAVDAVLLAPGMIRHCGGVFAGTKRPLAVVRLNWNSVYCFKFKYAAAKSVFSCDPPDALREGMDIALISLTLQTGDEQRDAANVEVFSRLTNACHALGIPVIGEYFPTKHETMTAGQLHKAVLIGSRIVTELGADAIKTFYTEEFRAVTRSCPVPVFGLGAEKLPTQRDALLLAEREVEDGASGVVFGRNAIQVPDPWKFQAALCDVVKKGAKADDVCRDRQLV